jgi:mono/diheme cytochrome c family protein/WD40 repeat protein
MHCISAKSGVTKKIGLLKKPGMAALQVLFLALLIDVAPVVAEALSTAENRPVSAAANYKKHCAACHGEQRLGAMGPALLPENLAKMRNASVLDVIRNGRPLTQMPAFSSLMTAAEIDQLTALVLTPPATPVGWAEADIRASRIEYFAPGTLPDKPVFEADRMNLFLVVELGDHHITVLDGDTFTPVHRFKTRFALHGGPKYSPDGRFVYLASRDGWISKFDIYNLTMVAEIRAGINTRNLAVSSDGKHVLVGNYLPGTLVLLNADDLSLNKVMAVTSAGEGSRVSAVYNAPPRNSFVAALKDIKEVWEIPYGLPAEDTAWLQPRKIGTTDYLDDFFFDPEYKHLIGASRAGGEGQVIDMDTGKLVTRIAISGMPHLGSGITWDYQGRRVLASPNLKESKISIIDMQSWEVIKELKTEGPGFFMRTHANSPYAWADVFFGPNKDAVHLIDKSTLEIVKTLRPVPGKTAAHVEFTKDGSAVLLSIWEMDGELIVYDAKTLEIRKRLPMVKPSGKYNVYNKTRYESGTSH